MMIFVAFLVFGAVIGGLFSNFTEGRGLNVVGSVLVGIVGAFAAGILAGIVIDREIGWYSIGVMLSSIVGSLVLLTVAYFVKK